MSTKEKFCKGILEKGFITKCILGILNWRIGYWVSFWLESTN